MSKNKNHHTVWSNLGLDVKDWEEGYRESMEMNGFYKEGIAKKITKEIGNNIRDFMATECEYAEWYVDQYGNFGFSLSPQGEDFWRNIFRRLAYYESQNKIAE